MPRLAIRAARLALLAACAAPAAARAQTPRGPAADSASAAPAALPLKYTPRPTAAAITVGDLMSRLYAFADDSMMGREAGTEGNVKATAFIARELARLGLRPAGENGTYFQALPFVRRTAAPGARLVVDGRTVDAGDFVLALARGTPRAFDGTAAVVFGGAAGQASLTREQAAGKVVLLRLETLGAQRIAASSPLAAAAAVVYAGPDRIDPALRNQAPAMAMAAEPGAATVPPQLFVTRAVAERMLGGRLDAATAGTAGRPVAATLRFTEAPAPARNVVAVLPGADAAVRGQYVALGAHNDHVGYARRAVDHDSLKAANALRRAAYVALDTAGAEALDAAAERQVAERARAARVNVDSMRRLRPARPDSINNGADDDGSGTAAVLAIAGRYAALPQAQRPARSLLFVWHTGEEEGLLGSEWFTDHPTVPRESIVAQINIDMIGRNHPDSVYLVGSRRASTQLGQMVEAANARQARPMGLDYSFDAPGHPEQIFCRSDHYNYARYGIPVTFFTTGLHEDYHKPSDEIDKIDFAKLTRITGLISDLVGQVAAAPARPAVDRPVPPLGTPCTQ